MTHGFLNMMLGAGKCKITRFLGSNNAHGGLFCASNRRKFHPSHQNKECFQHQYGKLAGMNHENQLQLNEATKRHFPLVCRLMAQMKYVK
jgi:hypothetical protein